MVLTIACTYAVATTLGHAPKQPAPMQPFIFVLLPAVRRACVEVLRGGNLLFCVLMLPGSSGCDAMGCSGSTQGPQKSSGARTKPPDGARVTVPVSPPVDADGGVCGAGVCGKGGVCGTGVAWG